MNLVSPGMREGMPIDAAQRCAAVGRWGNGRDGWSRGRSGLEKLEREQTQARQAAATGSAMSFVFMSHLLRLG